MAAANSVTNSINVAAHVGVVIAYVGKEGEGVSGDAFRHGNLVSRGDKGVWVAQGDRSPESRPELSPKVHLVLPESTYTNF
jgi:hypothetical protein